MENVFTLKIELKNAALEDYPLPEISRILRHILTRMEYGEHSGMIRDINGNHVGEYGIS